MVVASKRLCWPDGAAAQLAGSNLPASWQEPAVVAGTQLRRGAGCAARLRRKGGGRDLRSGRLGQMRHQQAEHAGVHAVASAAWIARGSR